MFGSVSTGIPIFNSAGNGSANCLNGPELNQVSPAVAFGKPTFQCMRIFKLVLYLFGPISTIELSGAASSGGPAFDRVERSVALRPG